MATCKKTADPFLKTGRWLRVRQLALERDMYICQECLRQIRAGRQTGAPRHAVMVHHIKPRSLYPEMALRLDNLESLCNMHHERLTPERRNRKGPERPPGQRTIYIGNEVENDAERKAEGMAPEAAAVRLQQKFI